MDDARELDLDTLALATAAAGRTSRTFLDFATEELEPDQREMLQLLTRSIVNSERFQIRVKSVDRRNILALHRLIRDTYGRVHGSEEENFGHISVNDAYAKVREEGSDSIMTEDGREILEMLRSSTVEASGDTLSIDSCSLYVGDLESAGNVFSIAAGTVYTPWGPMHSIIATIALNNPGTPADPEAPSAVFQLNLPEDETIEAPEATLGYTDQNYATVLAETLDCFLSGLDMKELFENSHNPLQVYVPPMVKKFSPEDIIE
jgi:hypothetical protein